MCFITLLIFSLPLSVTICKRFTIPWIIFHLVVSELLSQQSCQGQQKPQAIHCPHLQILLCIYYLIESLDMVLRHLTLNLQMGKGEHLFPLEV